MGEAAVADAGNLPNTTSL
uniref:Uncharacterized protein n=1 Tax=Arundo donax TaxID=35708 RepID=A0A0A9AFI4_ARUDO